MGRWLPVELNPLAQSGAAANLALLVASASGVLLLIWYPPSVQFAYSSLQAIEGRTLGGWVRALHRYSSDLTMLLLIVHAGRVFCARKFAGARWLPWVSGVTMLALIWFIGWTGYWLVWDQPAQQVAVASIRLLDGLPIFGEPLARLYVSDSTVPSLLFFVVFFLHMLLPLAIAIGLAVHLARVSRARLLPPRALSLSLIAGMALAAILVPAPLDAPAQMAVKAATFTVDAWYLSPLALALRFQHAGLWIALAGGTLGAALVPWLLGRRRAAVTFQAVVTPARCHACTQCVQDCPFDAITMVARTDGKPFPSQAFVDPARCVGCGVCAGSCDSAGISLTWFDTRVQEARLEKGIASTLSAGGSSWVALVGSDIDAGSANPEPARWHRLLGGYQVCFVPTASWVRPGFVEDLLSAGIKGVLVVRDGSLESWARDGHRWVAERLQATRSPEFRPQRAGGGAWCVVDFDRARPHELSRAAADFLRAGASEGGARRRVRPRLVAAGACAAVIAVICAATLAPSHLQVTNPAPADPELVLSFTALGEMLEPGAVDAEADAAKPVHMRGRSTEKPRRADVRVRVVVDGEVAERTFSPKGISRDGPAIGEWRHILLPGDRHVEIAIMAGPNADELRWSGMLRAEPRRLNVIRFDPVAGFVVE